MPDSGSTATVDGVGRVAEGAGVALRLVAGGRFQPAGIDVSRQILRAPVPGVRDLLQIDAAVRSAHASIAQHDLGRIELQQLGADPERALCQFAARRATAPPAMTMAREPHVPVE